MSGYFGKKPGFRVQPLTLSQIFTATFGTDRTLSGALTVSKTAQASTAESPIFRVQTSDSGTTTTGVFNVVNATSADAQFVPWLQGYTPGANPFYIYSYINTDTGTNPAMLFDARLASSGAVATRPLFAWGNNGGRRMTLWEAGLMIGTGTSTAAAAKLEVQDAATQLALGTAASQGFAGAFSTTTYLANQSRNTGAAWVAKSATPGIFQIVTDSFRWYLDSGKTIDATYTPTELARLTATGLGVLVTPGCSVDGGNMVRAQGTASPSSGSGAEMWKTGTTVVFQGYDRAGAAYMTTKLRGSTVVLSPGGTDVFTASTTLIDNGLPARFPSYTLATLPTAGSYTRAQIWVSDMTGGAQFAYSDGTNWRRVSDLTVAS